MANLVRWEPFNDVVLLRDPMDRLFEQSFIQPRFFLSGRKVATGRLPLDVTENADELVVKASVPGIKPEDIEITVVGDTLTIKGETKAENKQEKENYLLQERRWGSFQRTFTLPMLVQADKARAEFEHGVLTLTLPKADEIKPKQIKVALKSNGTK
ncbi:MAG: Hsp20/alpha crystallin family protein [Chloroflexi bacterium]|nr:Hsp20/alpha crystallin family protein [Chloroflexota bacterium]